MSVLTFLKGPMPILIEIAIILSLVNGILSPEHVSLLSGIIQKIRNQSLTVK